MVVFELNTFFFPLFPFCDSRLVCLGFLKTFATPHIGHHSSLSPLNYTFFLLPSPHYCSFKNVRLPSRLCTISTFFSLTDGCALLHCHQRWKEKADLLGRQPCGCLTAAFCGHWDLGCCCFLSVLLQWRKVVNYWYFLGSTLPVLCCVCRFCCRM